MSNFTYSPSLVDTADDAQPGLLAALVTTYAAAVICVALRFLARRLTGIRLWYDDWFVFVALLSCTGYMIGAMDGVAAGLGLHVGQLMLTQQFTDILYGGLLRLFIGEMTYTAAAVFVKLSLLAFYWRIFNVSSIRLPIKLIAISVIAWFVARFVAIIFHCQPISLYWNRLLPGYCGVKDQQFFAGTNTVNFVLDLVVLGLPMPYIYWLQLPKDQKMILFGMFALGSFVCIASVVLLVVCYQLDMVDPDLSWSLVPITMWAGTEINLATVAACLPSLRPIYNFAFKGTVRSRTSTVRWPGIYTTEKKSNNMSRMSRSRRNTMGHPLSHAGAEPDFSMDWHPAASIDRERGSGSNSLNHSEVFNGGALSGDTITKERNNSTSSSSGGGGGGGEERAASRATAQPSAPWDVRLDFVEMLRDQIHVQQEVHVDYEDV